MIKPSSQTTIAALALACCATLLCAPQLMSQNAAPQRTPGPVQMTPEQIAQAQKAHEEQMRTDWADLEKYRAANEALPAPLADETWVVFMGDSITEGWGKRLSSSMPDPGAFFPGKPYINRGISGQTSPQMLVRFRPDVINLKPKVVVILAGTNDIAENTGPMRLEDTESNLQSMSDLSTANGIRVVLCSVLPAKSFWWHKGIDPRAKIAKLNEWIRAYAARHGFPYVDYYDAMADKEGALRSDLSPDGVHPNAEGYAIMAPLAETAIAQALSTETK
jgi:lysophospholipase L1-like esterase